MNSFGLPRPATGGQASVSDVVALCYHAVSPTWAADLSVTPDALERQIDWFIRHGWEPVTFREAVLSSSARRTLSITFDDGFASVKDYAAPILEHFGAPATVFAPTTFMTGGSLSWSGVSHWLTTPDAHEMRAMTWNDLGELTELGWEVGSHTRDHPHLTSLAADELVEQIEGSVADCVRYLGRPAKTISYPYGDVDRRVAEVAQRCGLTAGAKLGRRLEPLGPMRHPTIGIYHTDSFRRFRVKVARPMRMLRASSLWPVG
jgi:peptidoglycan/xylan/chitin deacetylase (PgdA/CDA1 family)